MADGVPGFMSSLNIGFNGFKHAKEVLALDGSNRKTQMVNQDNAIRSADRADEELNLRRENVRNRMGIARAQEARREETYQRQREQDPTPEMVADATIIKSQALKTKKQVQALHQQLAGTQDAGQVKRIKRQLYALTGHLGKLDQADKHTTAAMQKVILQKRTAAALKEYTDGSGWADDRFNSLMRTNSSEAGKYRNEMSQKGGIADDFLVDNRKLLAQSDPESVSKAIQAGAAAGLIDTQHATTLQLRAQQGGKQTEAVRQELLQHTAKLAQQRFTVATGSVFKVNLKEAARFERAYVTPLERSIANARRFEYDAEGILQAALDPAVSKGRGLAVNNAVTGFMDLLGVPRSERDTKNLAAGASYGAWQTRMVSIVRSGIDGALIAGSVSDFEYKQYSQGAPKASAAMWKNVLFGATANGAAAMKKARLDFIRKHPSRITFSGMSHPSSKRGAAAAARNAYYKTTTDTLYAQFQRAKKMIDLKHYKVNGHVVNLSDSQLSAYKNTASNIQRVYQMQMTQWTGKSPAKKKKPKKR